MFQISIGIKKLSILFLFILIGFAGFAQAPQLLHYQGVARNAFGNAYPNKTMTLRLSIRTGTSTGAIVYSETRIVKTNDGGLYTVEIGSTGALSTTGSMGAINWQNGTKFLQVEVDPAAGNNFIDLGTTQFLSVPYAFGAGSAATVITNANLTGVVTSVGNQTSIANGAITSDMIASINQSKVGLGLVNNTSDAAKPVSSATQTALNLKENLSNKSSDASLGGANANDDLYPTQKAVKAYVAANAPNVGIADGSITNIKLADLAVNNSKIADVAASKITGTTLASNVVNASLKSIGTLNNLTVTNPIVGSVTGNAATATKLAASKNINGVPFDGTADITIAASGAATDLTGTTLASNVVNSSLTRLGVLSNLTVTNPITGSVTGNADNVTGIVSGVNGGTGINNSGKTITLGGDLTTSGAYATNLISTGATSVTLPNSGTLVTLEGTETLSNKTLTTPTLTAPSLGTPTSVTLTNATGLPLSTGVVGTLPIVNGGTGSATAAGARTNLGLVIGTDVQSPLSFTTPLIKNASTVSLSQATNSAAGYLSAADFANFSGKIDASQKAANNGVATLGNDGKIPSNQIPAVSFQSANVLSSQAAMLGLSNAQVGSIAIRTDNNNNYVLSVLPASTLSNWIQLATPNSVTSVNGYAGPNVTLTTSDVAEGASNKYYTDARVRAALSATSPLVMDATNGNISMPFASTSANGYLKATDFATFNNKQNTLSAGIDYLAPNGSAANLTNFPTLNQNTTGTAANVSGTVGVANGGTGATTLSGYVKGNGTASLVGSSTIPVADVTGAAPLASPIFTGTPSLPTGTTGVTQSAGDNSTKIATTAFVASSISSSTPDASTTVKGKIQLAGDLAGTAALPTVPGLLLKEDVSNKSNAALGNSTTIYPTQSAVKTYVDAQVASGAPDADATTKGKIQLAGDLGGTATAPTVPGLSLKANSTDVTSSLALKANTSDLSSSLALKAPLNNPTFTGTVGGISKSMVGLGNVDNTTDLLKPISTATQTALDLKANSADVNSSLALKAPLASPTFTGTPSLPTGTTGVTQSAGDNSTKIATTAFVTTSLSAGAPDATSSSTGKIQLSGDLSGTAAAPTIVAGAITSSKILDATIATADLADGSVTDAKIAAIAGSKVSGNITGNAANITGIVAVANGGTGATTLSGIIKGNGTSAMTTAIAGTDYQAPISLTTTGSGAATFSGNTLNIPSTTNYTLPTASSSALGGVKVGNNLSIDGSGVLSANMSGKMDYTDTASLSSRINAKSSLSDTSLLNLSGRFATKFNTSDTSNLNLTSRFATKFNTSDTSLLNLTTRFSTKLNVTDTSSLSERINAKLSKVDTTYMLSGYLRKSDNATTATLAGNITATTNTTLTSLASLNTFGTITSGTISLTTNMATTGTLKAGTVTYPNTHGTSGQVLTSLGSGTLSWTTASSGGIPYTGATGAVNLGGYDLTVNGLKIGTGYVNPANTYNTIVGRSALNRTSPGQDNTAIGYNAIGQAGITTTGDKNTAVGSWTLINNTGQENTAMGVGALQQNQGGIQNTALGALALYTNSTGSNNTALGYAADVSANNLSNATAIGNGAIVAASNTIQLGNTSVTNVKTSGTLTAGTVTYPNTNGITGQVLSATASGTITWATASGGLPTTGNTAGDMLYWNGTAWVKVAAGTNGQTLTYINNVPTWYGGIGTVVSTTGKIWMDRDLGASRVATSSTDYLAYGSIYQWGRGNDGHQLINFTSATAGSGVNTTVTTLSTTDIPGNSSFIGACPGANNYDWRSTKNDLLWQGVNGINNPCPSGFRLPTETEWTAEYGTWSAANSSGAFSSSLKLPLAGVRSTCGGGLGATGTEGLYWSSSVNSTYARGLKFTTTILQFFDSARSDGRTVRCIKN